MNRLAALLCLFLTLFTTACIHDSEVNAGDTGDIVMTGQPFPAFSVVLTDGRTVSPASLNGRPAVLVFFHTECGDCRRELPVIEDVWRDYGDRVGFAAISRGQSAEDVAAFWREKGLTLPVSPQTNNAVYNLFARHTIPRVYVADREGIVRAVFIEKVDKTQFVQTLNDLLRP